MLQYILQSKIMYENQRLPIWENDNFVISTSSVPLNCKNDGGQIIIRPKIPVSSITELSDNLMFEMMKLVQAAEKALLKVLNEQGIETPFTNNMDMGNWSVFAKKPKSLHFHIYGRALNSKKQIFGQALYLPDPHSTFYDNNVSLSQDDIDKIKKIIEHQL
jgi:diadenosine tetraphosphate (Ap4A) HIT family hydrolase